MKKRVFFAGGRKLGLDVLKWLCEQPEIDVVGVSLIPESLDTEISMDLRSFVAQKQLKVYDIEDVTDLKPDIGLSVNFHKVIKADVLNACCRGFYNIHHTYNLRLRGRNITTHLLLEHRNDNIFYHGTTLHKITPELDNGPIVASKMCKIEETDNAYSLFCKVDKLALDLIKEWFCILATQNCFLYEPPQEGVRMYKAKDLPDKKIDTDTMTSIQIYDMVRAFDFPGKEPAYFLVNDIKQEVVLFPREQYKNPVVLKDKTYYTT